MRIVGWAEVLVEMIESRAATPFEWGTHDCCLFAADAVLAITGVDYAEPVRGYTTRRGAQEVIDGYGGMLEMVTSLVGADAVTAAFARRGDIVLACIDRHDTLGVCMGVQCAFVERRRGVTFRPMTIATCAWRIV